MNGDDCGVCKGSGYSGPHGDSCHRCEGSGSDPWVMCEAGCGKRVRSSKGTCTACNDAEDEANGILRNRFGDPLVKCGSCGCLKVRYYACDRCKPRYSWR